jgi:hypothetical protein
MTFPRSSSLGVLAAFSALALGSVLVAGCDRSDKALSAEDDTNPHFHAASARVQERNFADAAKEYEEALRANPGVARAHYELGLLYGDHLNDPIAAMYHFEEYLRLRPGSEASPQAQARLDNAKIAFAATLPNSPVQNAEAFVKLQSDNQALQRDLEEANRKAADLGAKLASAQKELSAASPDLQADGAPTPALHDTNSPAAAAAANPAPAEAENAPAPAPAPAPVQAVAVPAPAPAVPGEAARSYTIGAGDTLWKISKKFYPGKINEGIEKIKAANPDTLPPGKPLKIGTALRIP